MKGKQKKKKKKPKHRNKISKELRNKFSLYIVLSIHHRSKQCVVLS